MGNSQKHNRQFLTTAQKHNAQYLEHNNLMPNVYIDTFCSLKCIVVTATEFQDKNEGLQSQNCNLQHLD